MTTTQITSPRSADRDPASGYQPRHYLMCAPEYFAVDYVINPWMHPEIAVDRARALRQWERLVECYRALGHSVELIDPVPGLPDMVYTANGATVIDAQVMTVRFSAQQRRGEEALYEQWHRQHSESLGWGDIHHAEYVNEGEGDFLVAGDYVLAGYGFRTDPRSHSELAEVTGRPVISLRLVSPWHYHLDTALAVLNDQPGSPDIAYYPAAFTPASRQIIRHLFPDALEVSSADARAFGLNMTSDGHHVILPAAATGLPAALRQRGYEPVPLDFDELLKGGGSIKCCTQTLRGQHRAD